MGDEGVKIPLSAPELVGMELGRAQRTYNYRDTILYALGVTYGRSEIDFCFEQSANPKVAPTFATVLSAGPAGLMRIDYKRAAMTHRRHRLMIDSPLPVEGSLDIVSRMLAVYDQGEGKDAIFVIENAATSSEGGARIFAMEATLTVKGHGGFGGSPRPESRDRIIVDPHKADYVEPILTRDDQALLYRLSGDFNPVHANDDLARKFGHDRGILHGLCTYGAAGKHLLGHLCGWDPSRFRSQSVAFTGKVYPGDPLAVAIKSTGPGTADYNVLKGDEVVLAGEFEYLPN